MGIKHNAEILLTVKEVAEYLNMNKSSITRMCHKNRLITREISGDPRFHITLSSVLAYRKSQYPLVHELNIRVQLLEETVAQLKMRIADSLGTSAQDPVDSIISDFHIK